MNWPALQKEILQSDGSAKMKAGLFLRDSKFYKCSKDEWRAFIAGVPVDVKDAIVEQMSAGVQLHLHICLIG